MIEVVFFDAGETILHPHPSFPELFAEVCRARGLEVSSGEVGAVQTRLAPHLVDLAEDSGVERGPSLSPEDSRTFWTYLYRRLLGELGLEDQGLAEELYSTFSSTSSYRLFDDSLPVLGELQSRGYRLGLISNFDGWLQNLLVELEVGDLFEVTVISGVEGVEKPDPAIYRLALERADVVPDQALHVGDSPSLDIEPALATGMEAVLIDRGGRYSDAPYRSISSLEPLPGIVGAA